MSKLSKIVKLSTGALIASTLLGSGVIAQQSSETAGSVGVEVSSPIYDYTITPGKVQQDIIKLKNTGNSAQTYYPEVLDFTTNNTDGTPVFLKPGEESKTYSLAKWISVSKEPIKLEPGQSEAINFNISVPVDAEPGGHYAGILFSTQPPEAQAGNIGLASKVGSIVLVRVSGDTKESASIIEFKTDAKSYKEANVKFTTVIENSGNVHVQPKGVITIKNIFGGKIDTVDVNNISANVLPESKRTFESLWKQDSFKLGFYTATVNLTYGNPAQTITAETSFWILPWTTILVGLAVIIIALLLLYFVVRKYNSWIISKARSKQD